MIIIQFTDNKYPFYNDYIAQVKQSLPENVEYELVTKTNIIPNCNDYRATSNIIRCDLASKNPNMIWMDIDVTINKWFDFEWKKGKVYFAQNNAGRFINWAFYVNGRCDFFTDMMKYYEETKPNHIQWFYQYCLTRRDEIELIPNGYLNHEMMSVTLQSKINKYGC